MTNLTTVRAAEHQVLDEEIKEQELDSRAAPDVSSLETDGLDVELSDFRLIILGAAFLALWATDVRSSSPLKAILSRRQQVYFRLL